MTCTTLWSKRLAITLAVTALWEAAYRLGILNPLIFGSPSLMLAAAMKDGPAFLAAFQFTAIEILVATIIAWSCGVVFGALAGAGVGRSLVFAPILSAAIAVPLVVFYPIAVAWLGIGASSKIAYGSTAGFFPIALATVLGIRSIDSRYAEMARAVGASRAQILRFGRRCSDHPSADSRAQTYWVATLHSIYRKNGSMRWTPTIQEATLRSGGCHSHRPHA